MRRRGALGLLLLALGCASPGEPPPSPARLAAENALASAETAYAKKEWSASARAFGHAAVAFGAIGEAAPEATARSAQSESLRRAGDAAGAVAAAEAALVIDRHLARPEAQARDLAILARARAAQGDLVLAIETAEAARAQARSGSALLAVVESDLALYLLLAGRASDRERAVELLRSVCSAMEAGHDARGLATAELQLGRAELLAGEPDAAVGHLDRARAAFAAMEDVEGLAATNELLAALAAGRGDAAAAEYYRAQARAGFMFADDRAGLARLVP